MIAYAQAVITGVLIGGLYGLIALGISLTWGILRVIHFAHFSFAFLAAYITYHLSSSQHWNPFLTTAATVPLFFLIGVGLQYFFQAVKLDPSRSLILTFGLFVIAESVAKIIWRADYRRIPLDLNPYFAKALQVGPFALPFLQVVGFLAALALSVGVYWLLHRTWAGKALRAITQDHQIAVAFGVDFNRLAILMAGLSAATAAVAGTWIGMTYALFPSAAEQWIGLVFAVVILGGLGNPLGTLGAGMILGVAESLTQTLADPSLARLVSLGILVLALLVRPQGLFRSVVPEVHQ